MEKVYIRLVPYNPNIGALCQHYCASGQHFEGGTWYRLPKKMADLLAEERQGTGCPYFEVIDSKEEWERKAKVELAAAMAGPGAADMAKLLVSEKQPTAKSPSELGEVLPSKFDGLTASEVSPEDTMRSVASTLVVEEKPKPKPKVVRKPSPRRRASSRKKTTATKKGVTK